MSRRSHQLRQPDAVSAQQLATIGLHAARSRRRHRRRCYIGRRNVEGGGRQDTFDNTGFRGVVGVRGAISRELGLRRLRAVLEGQLRGPHAEPLRPGAQSARDRRRSLTRIRRAATFGAAGLPLVSLDGIGSELRAVQHLRSRQCTHRGALDYLQAPTISDRHDRAGDLHRHRHGRPRRHRAAEPVRVREHPDGVRYRDAARTAWSSCPTCCCRRRPSVARAARSSASNGSAKVTDLLRRVAGPAGAGRPVRAISCRSTWPTATRTTTDSTTDTYKIGLDWAPIEDVRFRGSFQRAVRAANVDRAVHRAGLQPVRHAADADPCGRRRRPRRSQQCLDTGVPATPTYGRRPAGQPCRPVQLPAGRQPRPRAGGVGHRTRTASSSSRGSCRSWRCRSTTSTSRSTTRSRRFGPDNALIACYFKTTIRRRLRPHPPRPGDRLPVASATATSAT